MPPSSTQQSPPGAGMARRAAVRPIARRAGGFGLNSTPRSEGDPPSTTRQSEASSKRERRRSDGRPSSLAFAGATSTASACAACQPPPPARRAPAPPMPSIARPRRIASSTATRPLAWSVEREYDIRSSAMREIDRRARSPSAQMRRSTATRSRSTRRMTSESSELRWRYWIRSPSSSPLLAPRVRQHVTTRRAARWCRALATPPRGSSAEGAHSKSFARATKNQMEQVDDQHVHRASVPPVASAATAAPPPPRAPAPGRSSRAGAHRARQ